MSNRGTYLQWIIVTQVIPFDKYNTLVKNYLRKVEEAVTFDVKTGYSLCFLIMLAMNCWAAVKNNTGEMNAKKNDFRNSRSDVFYKKIS